MDTKPVMISPYHITLRSACITAGEWDFFGEASFIWRSPLYDMEWAQVDLESSRYRKQYLEDQAQDSWEPLSSLASGFSFETLQDLDESHWHPHC